MIKLEELKKGDVIYAIDTETFLMYEESKVLQELSIIETIKPIEAVWCTGGVELIPRNYENIIFRTEEEAREELYKAKIKFVKEMILSGDFSKRLMECATSSKRLNKFYEVDLFEIGLDLLVKGDV